MSISSISNSMGSMMQVAYENLPTPQQLLRNIQKVALPAIALYALDSTKGADAFGTIGCVICLAAGGGPACIPICVVALVTIPAPLG